jgi:hypothetical protein
VGKTKGKFALLEQITAKAQISSQSTQENYVDILEEDYQGLPVPDKKRHPHWVAFLLKSVFRFAAYRFALPVIEFALYQDLLGGETVYYYCPRCDVTLERDYQSYCDRCGQCLDWKHIHKAKQRQRMI